MTLLSTVYKSDWLTLIFDFQLLHYHPTRRILISINKSFHHLIYSIYILNKTEETTFADIDFFHYSRFIFKENQEAEKNLIVKEVLI